MKDIQIFNHLVLIDERLKYKLDFNTNLIDGKFGKSDVPFVEGRTFCIVRNVRVHERMFPDEVEDRVRKVAGVGNALARTRFGDLGGRDREPHRSAERISFTKN